MSVEHRYSVAEIDHMRVSVARLDVISGGQSSDRAVRIEARLRTYMLAGISPDDLRTAASPKDRPEWVWGADCRDQAA